MVIDIGRGMVDCVKGTQEEILTVICPFTSDACLHEKCEYDSQWTLN